MSTLVMTDTKLWFDGFDLSGDLNAIVLNYAADMVDETTFADDTHINKGGLKVATMAHEGFWEGGIDKVDDVLFRNIGISNKPISIGVETGADGERAYMLRAILGEYIPGGEVGEMLAFSVTAETSDAGLIRGTIMHTAAETASGNGTARQLGAVLAGERMYAALHVLAVSGTSPTLDVIIQSDDNSGMTSPANQITFVQSIAVESQWLTANGAITDDWWRVNFTIGGGSPSFTFIVVLGIL